MEARRSTRVRRNADRARGHEGSFTFPDETVRIEKDTFKTISRVDGTSILKLIVPDTVTHIGVGAIYANFPNVEIVKLGRNVVAIETYAFAYCSNLKEIIFPPALTTIGPNAFQSCSSLKSIAWPSVGGKRSDLHFIGASAFEYCQCIQQVDLRDTILGYIGSNAFRWCHALKSVEFSISRITFIGNTPFAHCPPSLWVGMGTIEQDALGLPNRFPTINNLNRWGDLYVEVLSNAPEPKMVFVSQLWPANATVASSSGFAQDGNPFEPQYAPSVPTTKLWLEEIQRVKTNLPDEAGGPVTIPAFVDIGDETLRGALIAAYPSLAHRSPWSIRLPGKVAHQLGAPVHSGLINDISIKVLGKRVIEREINLDFNVEIYFIRADQNGMVGTESAMPNRPVVHLSKRARLRDACC